MKKYFTLLLLLLAGGLGAHAQSPIAAPLNLGFEEVNYDGSLRNWGNIYLFIIGDSIVFDRQLIGLTPDAHSGNRALELRNCWNFTNHTGLAGSVSLDEDSMFTGWSSFEFVPVTAPPTTLSFWYRFGPVGGDTARARLLVFDSTGTELGQGLLLLTAANPTTYARAEVAVTYHTAGQPAFMNLNFSTFYTAATGGQRQPSLGTWLQIDDVALNTPLAAPRLLQAPSALQLFPNPTNDVLHVRVAPGAPPITRLELLSWCGQPVRTVDNPQQISLAGLAPGSYLVRLQTATGGVVMRSVVKL